MISDYFVSFGMQIFEIVNLANELLPPLPNGTITLPASSNLYVKGSLLKKSTAGSSSKQEETSGGAPEISAREKLLTEQPELLQQFGMDLLPILIQVRLKERCYKFFICNCNHP